MFDTGLELETLQEYVLITLDIFQENMHNKNIEDELDAADLKSYIDKLIEQLPPQRRRIFKMSREQHLTNKEIAERCAVSEKAIERQITMALKFLRDNLPMFIVFMG